MDKSPYAPPLKQTATAHNDAVYAAYRAATGTPPTVAAKLIYGDPKFGSVYAALNFTVATYDRFMGLMSACWPEWADWPADVPRPAPAEIAPENLAAIRVRQHRAAPTQPGVWPDDIPKPKEAAHG
jgi:hypothetical protein